MDWWVVRRCRRREQAGVSLIETLIVIVLVSLVVLVFAAGLQTSVTTDGQTSRQQRLNLALTSFAEGLRRVTVPTDYWQCIDSFAEPTVEEAFLALYNSLPADDREATDAVTSIEITDVSYWQPGDYSVAGDPEGGSWGSTCVPGAGAVRLGMRVTLRDQTLTGEVVKREPESA